MNAGNLLVTELFVPRGFNQKQDVLHSQLIQGQSLGNTFLIFDARKHAWNNWPLLQRKLTQSLINSGMDSLLFLEQNQSRENEFIIGVLEKDGSMSSFCGNGARVICRYLRKERSLPDLKSIRFVTDFGQAHITYVDEQTVSLNMGAVSTDLVNSMYFRANASALTLMDSRLTSLFYKHRQFYFIDSMEPHLYYFGTGCADELLAIGRELNRRRDLFPLGINVNCLSVSVHSQIQLKTYERGVNNITLACGTGACGAGALIFHLSGGNIRQSKIHSAGGTLQTHITLPDECVILTGPY